MTTCLTWGPSKKNSIPFSGFLPAQDCDITTKREEVHPWKPFTYKINEHGFRYNTSPKDKTVCFVGCSITFGVGLPQEDTFPELVTAQLGNDWQCMNLGVPSSGPDIQMTNLAWAVNHHKIDKIVWYMSDPLRQLFWKNDHPNIIAPNFPASDDSGIKIVEHIIVNEETILAKTYWNLYTLLSLVKEKNIDIYIQCWINECHEYLLPLFKEFNVKSIGQMRKLDIARDNLHHGPASHLEFAERITKVINES